MLERRFKTDGNEEEDDEDEEEWSFLRFPL